MHCWARAEVDSQLEHLQKGVEQGLQMLLAIQDVGTDDQVVRLLLPTRSSHARRIPAVSNCCEHLAPPILGFDKPPHGGGENRVQCEHISTGCENCLAQ